MDGYTKSSRDFVGYEYKEVFIDRDKMSMYLDAYQNFGWEPDENAGQGGYINLAGMPAVRNIGKISLRLKRDRKIINKAELTRLQRHFEACMDEIAALESAKASAATAVSIAIGVIGTAFMAGSVFAVTAKPPIIWLCVILGIPGIIGWILPYFVYKRLVIRKTAEVNGLVDRKYDEIYEICEKGSKPLF